ncbi:MAG: hypothetical protein DMD43_08760 [Gemmatimonadetes bacterium]|nr:MAG: hypothetical protein DMD43_08760 [Gemmatimonadota bacterium]
MGGQHASWCRGAAWGRPAEAGSPQQSLATAAADVVVLALPEDHRPIAEAALEHGAHVVSLSDDVADVRALLALDAEARERHRSVVVGAGFSPGLTCVLARHAAGGLDAVEEIHVAKSGTGGPACARLHHASLRGPGIDWRDGAWLQRRGGSGRELTWFPDPVSAQDCYRAAVPEALLLVPAFPGVRRVTARVARLGAARVEVRGRRASAQEVHVLGVVDRPAVAAGAVAAIAAGWAVEGRLARHGAAGLAELVAEPVDLLRDLASRGVKAAAFEGAGG